MLTPIMGPSGSIMFGPWAVYFPVSLGQGQHIIPICHPCQRDKGRCTALGTHYDAQGLHYLPNGLQYCRRAGLKT